jgi:hypothetical protein
VFVLSILWLVPKARRPGIAVAALWGAVAAWVAALAVVTDVHDWLQWQTGIRFGAAGAASGLVYRYLVTAHVLEPSVPGSSRNPAAKSPQN